MNKSDRTEQFVDLLRSAVSDSANDSMEDSGRVSLSATDALLIADRLELEGAAAEVLVSLRDSMVAATTGAPGPEYEQKRGVYLAAIAKHDELWAASTGVEDKDDGEKANGYTS